MKFITTIKILTTLICIILSLICNAQISNLESLTQSISFDGVRNVSTGNYVESELCEEDIATLFISDLWVTGFDPSGNLGGAVQLFGEQNSLTTDFNNGPILDSNQPLFTQCEADSLFDSNFVVFGKDVRNFIADNQNGNLTDIPDAIKYWPARGNPFFFEKYNVNLPLQELAPFFDTDQDGLYNPQNGDYPKPLL